MRRRYKYRWPKSYKWWFRRFETRSKGRLSYKMRKGEGLYPRMFIYQPPAQEKGE